MSFSDVLEAQQALALVTHLQDHFASQLKRATQTIDSLGFTRSDWQRDDGKHGGGWRLGKIRTPAFNRASINVSQVHYDDLAEKRLSSATAISTIIHPDHPLAPSFHMHISWTQMRDGDGYWRLMADLNPAIPNKDHAQAFENALQRAAGQTFQAGKADGEAYFFIPSLNRHRGISHFYLEKFSTGDFDADLAFASQFGSRVIDTYCTILGSTLQLATAPTEKQRVAQRDYHTAYILQVLTLDRGTTSGLLVHDQNDIGILGSLPCYANREILQAWIEIQPKPQDELLRAITEVMPQTGTEISSGHRASIAQVVREHYLRYPDALNLQAAGSIVPPTVDNHS